MMFARVFVSLCLLWLGCGAGDARILRGSATNGSTVTGRVVQNCCSPVKSFTYKNFMKSWGSAGSISINGNDLTTLLDSNSYPNGGTLTNNLGGSLFIAPDVFLGPMRMKWTGTLGGFFLGYSMTASSGGSFLSGSTFSGVDGDVTFTINPTTTSVTSNSIALGAKTFTVGAGLGVSNGDRLTIAQTGSLTNYMIGTITSYSGTTLVMDINSIFGSGTFASWNIWSAPTETNSFFISGTTSSGLSDMILCRDQDFATLASDPFYHKFVAVVGTENPRILRPMGESVNGGLEQQTNPLWALRKPLTSMSYGMGNTFPAAAFAGTSSGIDALSTGSYPSMPGSWTNQETFTFKLPSNTVTITIASPARLALPKSVVVGEIVVLRTTGALPTPLVAATGNPGQNTNGVRGYKFYYALDAGSSNIRIAETPGGAAINTSGAQSGVHSMSPTTARPILAVANNGSNIPRVTLPSDAGLATNDIVQVNMGNIGAFRITVVGNGTDIDLTTSYPSGATLNFSAGGQIWSNQTGLSPIDDPGMNGRAYLTTTSINVGSRGAKPVTGTLGMPLPPGNLITVVGEQVVGENVCVYDSDLDAAMCAPGGLYTTAMPIEMQVAMANRLNKHLWFNLPATVPLATVTSAITYIAQNLNSNLELYLEHSNEKWNGAFSQYYYFWRYGVAKDYAYNNSGQVQQAFTASGLRNLQIMQTARTAWTTSGRTAASLRRVMPVQAFGGITTYQDYLLDGDDLPAPNNAFPDRPIDNADIVSYANYWNGRLLNSQYGGTGAEYASLVTAANDYASGVPAQMTAALNWMYGDYLGTNADARPTGVTDFSVWSQTHTGGTNAGVVPGWEAVMASYDAVRAGGGMAALDGVMYEGGPDARPPSSGECTALSISGADCTRIHDLQTAFKFDAKGAQMVVDGQSTYVSVTFPHNKNGSFLQLEGPSEWSLLSGDFFSRPYTFYDGAVQYNQ